MAVHKIKGMLTLNRPAYMGMCSLDLSKTLMYDFHYNYIKKRYGDRAKLLFNSKLKDLIANSPKYREPCKVDWDKNLSLLCEAVGQYALQWAKPEIVELSVLSFWKEMVKGQIEERISNLKQNFKQPTGKVLQNVDVKAYLSDLHNKYVFVQADKAPNNIIICKRYYIETLIKELGLDNCSTPTGNSAYTSCQMSSEDIVNTHDTFMNCLMMTRDYLTYIGPPSCINLQ